MDNITHSLIGMAIGEATAQAQAKKTGGISSNSRVMYWLVSVMGNNIPDIDVILNPFTAPGKMSSLLHHRGCTHTLVFSIPLTLAILLLVKIWTAKKNIQCTKQEWITLSFLALLGVCTHLFADSWNSYGTHPFWPFNSRWFYGDYVFIVEPWIWLSLLPALYFNSFHIFLRRFTALAYFGILALVWFSGFVPQPLSVIFSIGTLLSLLLKFLPASKRIFLSLGVLGSILCLFFFTHLFSESFANDYLSKNFPNAKQDDLLLSPAPANPFCWQLMRVETEGNIYRVRSGVLAPFSSVMSAQECSNLRYKKGAAPLVSSSLADSPALRWVGVFEAPLSELRNLQKQSCWIAAFLKFARIPFWKWKNDPSQILFGDLRFDREESLGFAKFEDTVNSVSCPSHVPSWQEPRYKILFPQ